MTVRLVGTTPPPIPGTLRPVPGRASLLLVAFLAPATLTGCGGGALRAGTVDPYPTQPVDGPGAGGPGAPPCHATVVPDAPLVTEWPASEKARLESLAARQAVVVAYSGCSLRVLDRCRAPGAYAWRRTTLATETLEVTDRDQLWAQLPLGAAALEGELGRSGRLAIRTTVAGQFELQGADGATPPGPPGPSAPPALPDDPACAGATHLVTGISVGAFSLVSGGEATAAGAASVGGLGAGASSRRSESLMRAAGEPERCIESTDAAPHAQCGSPLQLFLRPLDGGAPAPPQAGGTPPHADGAPPPTAGGASGAGAPAPPTATPGARRALPASAGVTLDFPAAEDPSERWSLHDADGLRLCFLPCTRTVPPGSGWYLERAPQGGHDLSRVDLPARFPHEPGSRARAVFHGERGAPTGSAILFYALGIPLGVASVFILGAGFGDLGEPEGHAAPFIVQGTIFLGSAVASWWWWQWSHEPSFLTEAPGAPASARVQVGPGGIRGEF